MKELPQLFWVLAQLLMWPIILLLMAAVLLGVTQVLRWWATDKITVMVVVFGSIYFSVRYWAQ